ncbi:MAG: transporter substrate-binding domain-containing protein [Deltaproteobacteria bacterium]|nr:transporter substrate-binding domain-containing protein [Deltaproteobacteria bacterium]
MKKLFWLFYTLAFITAIPACTGGTNQERNNESMIEQVTRKGTLKIGMSTFLPWAMKDKNGELVGFEIDVAKRLADDLGVKAEFVPTQWSGIIPALITGKFDMIIGGMGITPQRNLKVNFSIPYDHTGMSLVANKELAAGFDSLDDFNSPYITLVVRMGSTSAAAVKRHMPKAKLLQFDDESQALQELLNGRAHGFVSSAPLPAFQALKYPDRLFLPLKENFTKEPIAFAIRKGDFDSYNYLNNWITTVTAEGFLRERKHYWFETDKWQNNIK